MTEFLHQQTGEERLIKAAQVETIDGYIAAITSELPPICVACPAAYACAAALRDQGSDFEYPLTPPDVQKITIPLERLDGRTLSAWTTSQHAQIALKRLVRGANQLGTGPSSDGTRCCLDPDKTLDITNIKPHDVEEIGF